MPIELGVLEVVRSELAYVAFGMEPYLGIVQKGATLNDYEYLVQSRPEGPLRVIFDV